MTHRLRTYFWAILGAQASTRSSILGKGKAFDAQKQFLLNVEDAINSAVDIPDSIERYQSTLQYARSKVEIGLSLSLYMIPSDMDLYIGKINGYNNLIVIASPDEIKSTQLGQNNVNDAPIISQKNFQSSPGDFSFEYEPVISSDESVIPQDDLEDEPIIAQSSQVKKESKFTINAR